MPIDLQRILEAAVKAALEEPTQAAPVSRISKKRWLSTSRAMLLGAGLVTAGRVVIGHKGRDMLDRVQQRIADSEWLADGGPDDDVEDYEDRPEDYEPDPDAAREEELADEDKEVDDDTPDEEQESDADPEQDEDEADAEPERPGAPRRRRRRHA